MEERKTTESINHDKENAILVSPIEAMKILGVSRNTLYEDLLKRDDFPSFRIKNRHFINRELLQQWANKQCSKK